MSTQLRSTRLIRGAGERTVSHVTPSAPAVIKQSADIDENLPGFQASRYFRQLGTYGQQGQVTQKHITRAVEDSRKLCSENGIGSRIIQIAQNYVLGAGVSLTCDEKEEGLQEWLDEYWQGYANNFGVEQFNIFEQTKRDGELIPFPHVNEKTGHTMYSFIDPLIIEQAIPESALDGGGRMDRVGKLILMDGHELTVTDGKGGKRKLKELDVARPNKDGYLEGDCLFFAYDRPANSLRGLPWLYPVIDFLTYVDSYVMMAMENMALQGAFIWDMELKGIPANQLMEVAKEYPERFDPGMVWVHNENALLTPKSPSYAQAYGIDKFGLFCLSYILGAKGIPRHWVAQPEGTNLASAVAAGEPTLKMLEAEAREFRSQQWFMLDFALDQAIRLGKLTITPEARKSIKLETPPIDIRDVSRLGAVLPQTAVALDVLEEKGIIDREQYGMIMRSLIASVGGIELEAPEIDESAIDETEKELTPEEQAAYRGYREKYRRMAAGDL